MPENAIRTLDLFAGAGGLTQGLHAASSRFETIEAVEFDRFAASSFNETFGEGLAKAKPIQRWLQEDPMPEGIDVIVGGPPCQGFSSLGKREIDDERNILWRYYGETIARLRPKYFVVENVAAFAVSPQFAAFMEAINGGFLSDYGVEHAVVNAADFGVPQARKRTIMIGFRRGLDSPGMPVPTHTRDEYVTVRQAFAGLPRDVTGLELPAERYVEDSIGAMAGSFRPTELHLGRRYTDLSLQRFAAIGEGQNRFNLPDELLAPCWRNHKTGSADVMGRLHWDKPSVTIRTEFFKPEKGRYLHPTLNRAITHLEAARLQGFPDSHRFVGSKTTIAKQIGNAVPIQLGAAIGRALVDAIG